MARALTAAEKQRIQDALDLVTQILDCFDQLVQAGSARPHPDQAELRSNLRILNTMLARGDIDVDSNIVTALASADGDGIHFDSGHPAFPLNANDPVPTPVSDAWLIIQTLLHEKYHYLHHTGFGGFFNKFFGFFGIFGLTVLKIGGVHEGSLLWWEYTAYWHSYRMLGVLDRALFWVCLKDPDCLEDCEEHKRQVEDARNKQKPY